MSENIKNIAYISYNGITSDPTCPTVTTVEPNIEIKKFAVTSTGLYDLNGTIGEDRIVTYYILLINYSSKPFTHVVVNDTLTLPEGVTSDKVSYLTDKSYDGNNADLPDIQLVVEDIPAQSHKMIYYTIQFDDTVELNSIISNKANVNYDENTFTDAESGEVAPIPSNPVNLTIDYSSTTVEATKTGKDNVLCGENFDYVLTFTNTGDNEATDVTITDELSTKFNLNTVTIVKYDENNTPTPLTSPANYTYTATARPFVITSVGTGLNIPPKGKLVVTINGNYSCS